MSEKSDPASSGLLAGPAFARSRAADGLPGRGLLLRRLGGAMLAMFLAMVWVDRAGGGVGIGTIEESPELIHARLKAKAEQEYKDGMEALARGDTRRAVGFLLRVAKARIDSPYPAKAFEQLKTITAQGVQDFQVARELVAGEDPEAGVLELTRIVRTYFGLYPAKQAGILLAELNKNSRFQQALMAGKMADDLEQAKDLEKQAEALAKGEEIRDPEPAEEEGAGAETAKPKDPPPKPMTAEEREAARIERISQAYDAYRRIAAQCPDTAPGKEAAAAIARLEKDKDLVARMKRGAAEAAARQWLGLAENYFKAGRPDLAREYCAKILAKHAEMPQADAARALLGNLKK